MTADKRQALTKERITWRGDLSDDCSADWAGLLLRAEWMEKKAWWWCVYDIQDVKQVQIDSSNHYSSRCISGVAARANAVKAARRYLLELGCVLKAPPKRVRITVRRTGRIK